MSQNASKCESLTGLGDHPELRGALAEVKGAQLAAAGMLGPRCTKGASAGKWCTQHRDVHVHFSLAGRRAVARVVTQEAPPLSDDVLPAVVSPPPLPPALPDGHLLGAYAAKICPRRLHLDYDPTSPKDRRVPDPDDAAQRKQEGIAFEEGVGMVLASALAPADTAFLEGDRTPESLEARAAATEQAMADGVRMIWNPRLRPLPETGQTGEPDILVRTEQRDPETGRWRYLPVDVKNHKAFDGTAKAQKWMASPLERPWREAAEEVEFAGTPRLDDSLQLAHYRSMLAASDLAGGSEGGIIGRTEDGRVMVLWRDLDAPMHTEDGPAGREKVSPQGVYAREFDSRLEIAERAVCRGKDPSLAPLVGPEWKTECGECPWREVCHEQLVAEDHITLLPGVTPRRAQAHYAAGVRTVEQLAHLDRRTASLVEARIDVPALMRAAAGVHPDTDVESLLPDRILKGGTKPKAAAALAAAGIVRASELAGLDPATARYAGTGVSGLSSAIDQARVARSGRIHLARGAEVPDLSPAQIEADFDMENDRIVYLWGLHIAVQARDGTVVERDLPSSSFVESDEAEARVFADFWGKLSLLRGLLGPENLRAYHYTTAEISKLRGLAAAHAGKDGVPAVEEVEAFLESGQIVDLHEMISKNFLWPTENLTVKTAARFTGFEWRDPEAGGGNSIGWYRDAVVGETEETRAASAQRVLDYNTDDTRAQRHLRSWLRDRLAEGAIPRVEELDALYERVPASAH